MLKLIRYLIVSLNIGGGRWWLKYQEWLMPLQCLTDWLYFDPTCKKTHSTTVLPWSPAPSQNYQLERHVRIMEIAILHILLLNFSFVFWRMKFLFIYGLIFITCLRYLFCQLNSFSSLTYSLEKNWLNRLMNHRKLKVKKTTSATNKLPLRDFLVFITKNEGIPWT